jgi:diguanylate cyclase (GGDEF)-like protein
VSTNDGSIRALLIGNVEEASRVCCLLGPDGCKSIVVSHASDLDLAVDRLSRDTSDILLLDVGTDRIQGRGFVKAARAAAPDVPMVILSETEDEELAIEALQEGVQDFLVKVRLDGRGLSRSLRYAIERHRLQKTLQTLTLIDDLTGLHNRRGFLALAGQHLRVILRKGAALMVYLDLDDLKAINDTFGHLEGNRVLVATANILRACFRQSDILARLGGDEFCVLMTDATQDSAQQVRKRVQERVDFINSLSTWQYKISLSIGIAEVPVVHQPSLEDLLKTADARMYEEKRNKQIRGSFSLALKQPTVA